MNIDEPILELIQMSKTIDGPKTRFNAPAPGSKLEVKLVSFDNPAEKFTLSIAEGARSSSITLAIDAGRKTSMQTRRLSEPLVRIDIDDHAVHTNPDGSLVKGSHVHIASVESGCRWAFPASSDEFIMVAGDGGEIPCVFESFREFCSIERALEIVWSLGV